MALAASPVRRLGALGVVIAEDAERLRERLRLSNAEYQRLEAMADRWWRVSPAAGDEAARTLLYRLGPVHFLDRVLLAWSRAGAGADDRVVARARHAARALGGAAISAPRHRPHVARPRQGPRARRGARCRRGGVDRGGFPRRSGARSRTSPTGWPACRDPIRVGQHLDLAARADRGRGDRDLDPRRGHRLRHRRADAADPGADCRCRAGGADHRDLRDHHQCEPGAGIPPHHRLAPRRHHRGGRDPDLHPRCVGLYAAHRPRRPSRDRIDADPDGGAAPRARPSRLQMRRPRPRRRRARLGRRGRRHHRIGRDPALAPDGGGPDRRRGDRDRRHGVGR